MADTALASLRYGYERNQLGVKLVKRDEIASDNGQYTIHVDVQIPLDNIILLPRGAGEIYEAKVRVWVQAQDTKGGLSDVTSQPVKIEIPAEDIDKIKGMHYAYSMPLRVNAGDQKVAVGCARRSGRQEFGHHTCADGG